MSEWQEIETAPKYTAIMIGKWSEDDQIWFWQASGAFEDEGMWIDFTDLFHTDPRFFHGPTHWRPLDTSSPKPFVTAG